MNDVTAILRKTGNKNSDAYEQLMPIVYEKLREIAYMRIRREDPEHTYSKTDLVHEAYIKLIDIKEVTYNDRAHFYAMASRCMRRILIDHARKKVPRNAEEVIKP